MRRADLRRLIDHVLISDSNLTAFTGDYFHSVYRQFTTGMDRTQKVTLLLDDASPYELLSALRDFDPERFDRARQQVSATHIPGTEFRTQSGLQTAGLAPVPLTNKHIRKILLGGVVAVAVSTVYVAVRGYQESPRATVARSGWAQEKDRLVRKELDAQLKEWEKKLESLLGQLNRAKDEATRLALQAQLKAERDRMEAMRSAFSSTGAGAGSGNSR